MPPAEDLSSLLEQVPAILYISDLGTAGAFQYVSRWIEPILGFTVEEWCADRFLWVTRLHPDDRDRVIADEDGAAFIGDPPTLSAEYRMIHRDGRVVWIQDEAILRRDADGELRWHGVLSDITQRKQTELELERQAAAHAAVASLGEHALQRASLQALFDEACEAAARVIGVESSMVAATDSSADSLELRASYGWSDAQIGTRRVGLGNMSQVGYALVSGRPAQVDDWDTETRFEASEPLRHRGVRSSLCVRIEGADGPFGIFGVLCQIPHAYTDGDVHFIQSLANVLSDALERQRIEDAIEHRALHDPLTTLPNRTLFLDRLEHAVERVRRRGSFAAVLFIDLDHFKQVNDRLGHHVGDELLVSVAMRLREAVRPSDTVARFGGDEFGLLLEDIATERDAIATAERIAAGFARPFVLEAGSQFVTASIGIALTGGQEQSGVLVRDADTAMYRAKERGRARYEVFDENMRNRALARLRMETELRRAFDHQELRVDYRPIVTLADEAFAGVEAVLCWEHPERGELRAPEFITVAEESGVRERIGQWVIEQACRDVSRWMSARPDQPPLALWLNVSISELANRRFPEILADLIDGLGLEPSRIGLELRERTLAGGLTGNQRALGRLKAIGVQLAIDDVGPGSWSLAQVATTPIDTLKLDRRFVAELCSKRECERVTRSVIALADALGMEVVAKGVETPEQVAMLRSLGCAKAQGPLFSVAVSAREITTMLLEGTKLKRTLA